MQFDCVDYLPRLERKNSFPSVKKTGGRDFRKEFKGSILETRAQTHGKGLISSILGRLYDLTGLSKKSQKKTIDCTNTDFATSEIDCIPCEVLIEIFSRLDRSSAAKCREVCSRWKDIIEESNELRQSLFTVKTLSRLCIRGLTKKESGGRRIIEMRWVDYDTQSCKAINIPAPISFNSTPLFFAFSQFNVQRIIIQDIPFNDELVHFLRMNLHSCPLLAPVQLTLNNIDFGPAKTLTLHQLLAVVGKSLEVIEIQSAYGMRPLDLTDAHVSQLDETKIRRLVVDNIRMSGRMNRCLQLGDESLCVFMSVNNYPTLVLDRCAVTTRVVCDYSQKWLDSAEHDENSLHRHQVCTVKRCQRVNASHFEDECSQRRLTCRRSSVTRTQTIYNIQSEHGKDEFTFALCPAPMEEKKDGSISV